MDTGFKPIARATLRWLTSGEGGRRTVPPGPEFAATARLGSSSRDVSFVLRYRNGVPAAGDDFDADIAFLAPEIVMDQLAPGVLLSVLEGPRLIAQGQVEEVQAGDRLRSGAA